MKIFLFIMLLIFIANAVAYFVLQLIFVAADTFHDKWLYNKGICRNCGGDYKFFNRVDNYEFHKCAKCGQMILIKNVKIHNI